MKTAQFEKLIQAATGRPLTIDFAGEEIPLETSIEIQRPWKDGRTTRAFTWKTPKKEDSLLRSFVTSFCAAYREPDPAQYSRRCSVYGDTWAPYAEEWENPATHWNCSLWHHHSLNMLSKEKLRQQVQDNFASFDSSLARLGFYETNYGIGIFTIYGGQWIRQALDEMAQHLAARAIPFRNELSDAGWVTRFVLGLDKPTHGNILGAF
jgi:hypothetical protein